MIIEEQVFKEKPILVIKNEKGRIFFSAGLTKCKLIISNLEAINAFIAKHEPKEPENKLQEALQQEIIA